MRLFGKYAVVMAVLAGLVFFSCEHNGLNAGVKGITSLGEAGTTDGTFSSPRAVEIDSFGNIHVIDKSGRVQIFDRDLTFSSSFLLEKYDNGTPTGFCISPDGRLFIADTHNSRLLVYSPEGEKLGEVGEYGDKDGKMIFPTDIALDREGNLYVTEYGRNDRIIKFSKDLEFIEEWGGFGTEEGKFQRPMALAIDANDRIYVSDSCNHRIQVFDLEGKFLKSIGKTGTGPGEFNYPYDIAIDDAGNLLVCEYGNNRIQKLTTEGVHLAFYGSPGRDQGQLYTPWGVAVFGKRILVANMGNNRIEIFNLK